jgi:hypothetical protein
MVVLFGGRVAHVRVEWNQDGETAHQGIRGGDRVFVTMAGYLAPSAFGLAAMFALNRGRADVVLWVSVALFGLVLPAARSSAFAVVTLVALGLAFAATARQGPDPLRLLVACTWAWLLLMGGLRDNVHHWTDGADHATLRERTKVPALVWAVLFTGAALGALIWAGLLMTGVADAPG